MSRNVPTVDLVEQPDLVAFGSDEFNASQEFQHPVREGCGARAASREGKNDQILIPLVHEVFVAGRKTNAGAFIF
jgi:hypothetical protein